MTYSTSTTTTCSTTGPIYTTTTSSVAPVTTGAIIVSCPSQTEFSSGSFFDDCKEGISNIFSFSENVFGQTVIAIKSFTDRTPYLLHCPQDVQREIFARCISRPKDFFALGSTCRSLELTSKPLQIYAHANDFASLPASSITVDSYKRKVAELEVIFPDLSRTRIEVILRQAILNEHKDAFAKLSECYADHFSAESRTFANNLRIQFESEKTALEMELGELCGPNGYNGTVDAAWRIMDHAERDLENAEHNFRSCSEKCFPISVTCSAEDLSKLNFWNQELKTAQEFYLSKKADLEQAKKEFDGVSARLNELAVWSGNQLTGGKIFDAQLKAENQYNMVIIILTFQLYDFCAELAEAVTEENEQARFEAMKSIIG